MRKVDSIGSQAPIEPAKAHILIVDDEAATLRALKHRYRRIYRVHTAINAHEALEILESQPISLLLSDEKMPGMKGHELFIEARQAHPDVARVLMTGYSNPEALRASLDEGEIFAYVKKPFDSEELDQVMQAALRAHRLQIENNQVTARLKEANAYLLGANEDLNNFAHVVAHDLKEPLRTIRAYSLFMKSDCEGEISELGWSYLSKIDRSARHLGTLIDDLLMFSQAGNPGEVEPVALPALARAAVDLLQDQIDRTGAVVEVMLDSEPAEAMLCMAEASKLTTVLQNLISNGIKFNESTPPRIRVYRAESSESPGRVSIAIEDNGVGIAPENIERVFKMFERLHDQRRFPGTGAGLAVARKIVESLGGRIDVHSTLGAGTTFVVTLMRPPI